MERSFSIKESIPSLGVYLEGEHLKTRDQIPSEWQEQSTLMVFLWEKVPEKLYTEEIMAINDRFVIAGVRKFTWNFIYRLVMECRKYSFEECYTDDDTGINTSKKLQMLLHLEEKDVETQKKYKSLGQDYLYNLSEELIALFDKVPTREHVIRLQKLAVDSGVDFNTAWANDYDIRMRKKIPYGEPNTITDEFGREFLFFVFLDPTQPAENRLYRFIWMNVGNKCAWKNCVNHNAQNLCSRCKKALYCNVEHQKLDWKDKHRNLCKP